jgi:biotin carboxyl carrier protein
MSRPVRVTVAGEVEIRPVDLDLGAPDAPTTDLLPGGLVTVDETRGGTRPGTRRRAIVTPLPAGRGGGPGDGRTRLEVVVDGWRFELDVEDAVRAALRRRATRTVDTADTSGPAEIRAIIPGRVAAVRVTAGDAVEAGRTLLVVEAMKMQNELRAPRAGTVERVAVGEGETIENGDLLVVLG